MKRIVPARAGRPEARALRVPAAALVILTAFAGPAAYATDQRLPLPDAPVRLVIPDAVAFDAALGGSFRGAATGEVEAADPLVSAWRQSPVGTKLEAEWSKLSSDLPWTWAQIRRLQPRSVGAALVSAARSRSCWWSTRRSRSCR